MRGLLGATAATALVLAAAGCSPGTTATSQTQGASTATWTAPGPFTYPADQLVVPSEYVPSYGGTKAATLAGIERAYGTMLESVSVEATRLAGWTYEDGSPANGFWVTYRLVDCPVPAGSFIFDLNDDSLVPPLTQFAETPPGRDWMSGARLRELLAAYHEVTGDAFGGLKSYATATEWNLDSPPSTDLVTNDGKKRDVADLWVITPGALTQKRLRAIAGGKDVLPSYIFSFPRGGKPEFIRMSEDLGELSPLTDY